MPRKLENRTFVENQYRYLSTYKKASAAIRLRAVDRLAVMCGFLKITLEDQEPESGKHVEELPVPEVNNKVEAMLQQAARDRKKGGANADKLSEGSN